MATDIRIVKKEAVFYSPFLVIYTSCVIYSLAGM